MRSPRPATISWTPDRGAATDGAWRYPRRSDISRPAAVDRFADCFTAAIERGLRQATEPVVVPLSGGHDSRHILLAMHELGRLPDHCVTVHPYPPAAADEVAVATTVAAALGVRHVLLQQREHRVAAEREKNVLTHYCSDEHVQFMPLRDYFSRRPFEVFDGLAGDVLSQSQRLDASLHRDFVDGRFEPAAERILGDAQTHRAGARSPADAARRGAVHPPARRLAPGRRDRAPCRRAESDRRVLLFLPHAPRSGARAVRRAGRLPGLDAVSRCGAGRSDALAALRASWRIARLHTETLHRRYPAWAHLPFDGKRKGQEDTRGVRRSAAALLALALRSRSALIDTAAIAARAARTLVSGVSAHVWFLPRMVQLLDVERRYTEFTD